MAMSSKCMICLEKDKCKAEDQCRYNACFTRIDMEWREYHEADTILDSVEYRKLILAIQQECEIDREAVIRVAKDIIEQRLQDFWYLVNLNADQLIKEAKNSGI